MSQPDYENDLVFEPKLSSNPDNIFEGKKFFDISLGAGKYIVNIENEYNSEVFRVDDIQGFESLDIEFSSFPDMTWEEFSKDKECGCNISGINYFSLKANDTPLYVYEDYTLYLGNDYLIGKFKSFRAIKRIITAILEGVEK